MRLCFWTAVAIIGLLSMWGCRSGDTRRPADLSHVEVDPVTIKQYGKAIFTLDTADLATQLKILKPEFPLFLKSLRAYRGLNPHKTAPVPKPSGSLTPILPVLKYMLSFS